MKPPVFRYEKATSIDSLLAVLAEQGDTAKILAGGQSLVPMLNFRLTSPEVLVDINGLTELDYVRVEDGKLLIGTLTRHKTLKDSSLVAELCPLMTEAYAHVAHAPVRNRGTIGGNLSHADPASEMPAVAMCLDATFVLRAKGGERTVPASDFFLGALETALEPTELLAEVQIPCAPAGEGWSFQEVSPRKGDFALAAVATTLRMSNGVCQSVRIAHAGVNDHAARATEAEQILAGEAPSDERFDETADSVARSVQPTEGYHADEDYKRDLVRALTKRTLKHALERCGG